MSNRFPTYLENEKRKFDIFEIEIKKTLKNKVQIRSTALMCQSILVPVIY
jgi:hypothetical protein